MEISSYLIHIVVLLQEDEDNREDVDVSLPPSPSNTPGLEVSNFSPSGAFTSGESMLLHMACQQCLAPSTSIKVYGDLNLSILFPDKDIQVFLPDNATPCLCGSRGESMSCAFSSFMLTKQFQTLMEFYKILSEGLTPSVLILSSKIVFNCMMILNFRKR